MQKNGYEHSQGSVERLRADIDDGLAGDKVDFPDPTAAPLGADDEAAGTPVSARRVRLARQDEIRHAGQRRGTHYREAEGERTWVIVAMAAAAAAVAAGAVIALFP